MEIVITESAALDIADGYEFYEPQQSGLGNYFVSSIMSDLYSLETSAGVHEIHFRSITEKYPLVFHLQSFIVSKVVRSEFMLFSTHAATRIGSASG